MFHTQGTIYGHDPLFLGSRYSSCTSRSYTVTRHLSLDGFAAVGCTGQDFVMASLNGTSRGVIVYINMIRSYSFCHKFYVQGISLQYEFLNVVYTSLSQRISYCMCCKYVTYLLHVSVNAAQDTHEQ
jgi:hypothetical protein